MIEFTHDSDKKVRKLRDDAICWLPPSHFLFARLGKLLEEVYNLYISQAALLCKGNFKTRTANQLRKKRLDAMISVLSVILSRQLMNALISGKIESPSTGAAIHRAVERAFRLMPWKIWCAWWTRRTFNLVPSAEGRHFTVEWTFCVEGSGSR